MRGSGPGVQAVMTGGDRENEKNPGERGVKKPARDLLRESVRKLTCIELLRRSCSRQDAGLCEERG